LLKGIGDGEPIASDRFMVGGHEWVLLFYPDGKRSMSDGNAPNQPQDDPYAALFVALIGEGQRPLGVVQSGQGRVVRAFHRFTLVDQSGNGRHITKGRQREQGAVKISCARQDPQARNCHGYRKFVRRSVLEASGSGYLVDDVVVIRYEIELVVTSGGALNKSAKLLPAASVNVPTYPTIGKHLVKLLYDPEGNFDCAFQVEGEKFNAHKLVLASRSSVFAAMLRTGAEMREGREGVCTLLDIKPEVFRLLLHFVYADEIPPGGRAVGALAAAEGDASISGGGADEPGAAEPRARPGCASDEIDLDVPMTQHLLVAADRFDLSRLRAMCEARLCESVDVDTVANTLMLAELNHANALKRSCMSFIAVNLSDVMETEGYDDMIASCPHLASEILSSVAEMRATKQHQPVGGALDANAAGVNVHANPGVSAAAVATAAARDLDVNQGGVLALPSNVGTDLTANAATIPTMSAFSNFLASRVQRLAHSPPTPLDGVAAVGTRAAIDAEDAAAIATAQAAAAPPPSGVVTPPRPPAAETRRDADAADAGRRVRPRR
jgi:speckle-type POZ protein